MDSFIRERLAGQSHDQFAAPLAKADQRQAIVICGTAKFIIENIENWERELHPVAT